MDDYVTKSLHGLYTFEGNVTWTRYNVMLVANSIILSGVALLISREHLLLPSVSLVGGFILCLLWYRLTTIGFGMVGHYFRWTCERENQLPEQDRIFNKAGAVSWGNWDVFKCAKAVIWVFMAIYGLTSLWLVIQVSCNTEIGRCLASGG